VNRLDLSSTTGFLVSDKTGRIVGRVECEVYGGCPGVADALSVRSGLLSRRRRIVPAQAIEQIDGVSGIVALRFERDEIQTFLWRSGGGGQRQRSFQLGHGLPAADEVDPPAFSSS
jgi:hypothetical protein